MATVSQRLRIVYCLTQTPFIQCLEMALQTMIYGVCFLANSPVSENLKPALICSMPWKIQEQEGSLWCHLKANAWLLKANAWLRTI